jgi:apolipoprotein D and lipocalin family protein
MYRLILISIIALGFIGCSQKHAELPTVDQVDITKYQGKWYEIARFDHFFERGCKNVTATYTLKEDKTLKVTNRCVDIKSDEEDIATGVAYAVDDTNSKLKVSFFRPFYGDYYIIDLASDYSYAVVGSPSRELLWILSRTKKIDQQRKNNIIQKVQKLGFDPSQFIWTIQD